jgi:hypothetical protein
MNRISHIVLWLIVLAATGESFTARADAVRHYRIVPGGQYSYLPSPEGPGIPGCDPSDYECAFGVAGQFSLEFSDTGIPRTAVFSDLDLVLTGNEDIQNNPPLVAPVTADRVEAWLAARVFNQEFIGAPINFYRDSQLMTLGLSDFLQGTVGLFGGYDNRPVDGDGLHFNFRARLIPEPCSLALVCLAALGSLTRPSLFCSRK